MASRGPGPARRAGRGLLASPIIGRGWAVTVVMMLALLSLPIASGGDHFDQGRFLVPWYVLLPLPALSLVMPRLASWRSPSWRRALCGAVACSAVAAHGLHAAEAWQAGHGIQREFEIGRHGRRIGEILNRVYAQGLPAVGVIAAGGVGYQYRGRIVDLLGVNLPVVAHWPGARYGMKNHASFSPEAFYQLLPDLAFPRLSSDRRGCVGRPADVERTVTKGITADRQFRELYERVAIRRADGSPLLEDRDFFLPLALKRLWQPLARRLPLGQGGLADGERRPPVQVEVFVKRGLEARRIGASFVVDALPACEAAAQPRERAGRAGLASDRAEPVPLPRAEMWEPRRRGDAV